MSDGVFGKTMGNLRKPKYSEIRELNDMDTDSFIVDVKKIIFTKTLQKMLKQLLKQADHYIKEKNLKSNWTNER